MFKKLRIKLTLINMGIIMAILLVVFTFVHFSMRTTFSRQVINIKKAIESGTVLKPYNEALGPKGISQIEGNQKILGGALIVVEVDKTGLIEDDKTYGNTISKEDKKNLYELVKDDDKDMKYIKLGEKYFITFFIKKGTTKYYFIEATQEREIIASVLRELMFIFIGAIILVLLGNLVMTKKAIEPIKKAWEKQKRFVGDASHELRTPISAIKTNMEIVSEDDNKTIGEHRKWIDNIDQETNRMSELVNKLLFLSRKDSEDNKIFYDVINLAEEIKIILKEFEIKFKNKNITFESSLANTYIKADKTDIHQLISSLLDNAFKYTESGRVKIKIYEDSFYSVLEISDTGIGVSEEEKYKIFERFYRVDRARRSAKKGYGLGLSIVKSIVEEYNGKIELKSKLNKGSTFIIKIPTMEHKEK
ncbi:MAG: HAMP domain-containing histidine kinase [Clostridiales bacterium]|nr:HAMP domain-containing histidine kinase [Clostridiales bacterium]